MPRRKKKEKPTFSKAVRDAFRESGISISELERLTRRKPKIEDSGVSYFTCWRFSKGLPCSQRTQDAIAAAVGLDKVAEALGKIINDGDPTKT